MNTRWTSSILEENLGIRCSKKKKKLLKTLKLERRGKKIAVSFLHGQLNHNHVVRELHTDTFYVNMLHTAEISILFRSEWDFNSPHINKQYDQP